MYAFLLIDASDSSVKAVNRSLEGVGMAAMSYGDGQALLENGSPLTASALETALAAKASVTITFDESKDELRVERHALGI